MQVVYVDARSALHRNHLLHSAVTQQMIEKQQV